MYSHFSVDSGQFDSLLSGYMGVNRAALVECGTMHVHLQTPCLLFATLPCREPLPENGHPVQATALGLFSHSQPLGDPRLGVLVILGSSL